MSKNFRVRFTCQTTTNYLLPPLLIGICVWGAVLIACSCTYSHVYMSSLNSLMLLYIRSFLHRGHTLVHAGSRERKWFEVQQAVDTLRSRQNYAKLDYFELACRTARNKSSTIPSSKTAVSVDSDDGCGLGVDIHAQVGLPQPVHESGTSRSTADTSNTISDYHQVQVHSDCIQKCLCV